MSTLQSKKRQEAEENMKHAAKYLTKTLFRRSFDYLSAAPYLEKAADAYRAASDWDLAKKTFYQAADAQQHNKSSFRAAQNCENVAKVVAQQLRENRSGGADKIVLVLEAKRAYEAASGHYGDMGELGKAADALVKAATMCEENGMMDEPKDLYLRACSLMETQDKPHFAVDVLRKTLNFMVKNQLLRDARALVTRQIVIFKQIDQQVNVFKCNVSEIVLLLAMNDIAAADKAYMQQLQEDAFLNSDECALAEDLVRAYKTGNEELLQTTIKKQGFSFLDNQIGRLARKLTLYGGGGAPAAPAPVRSAPRPAPPVAAPAPARAPVAVPEAPKSVVQAPVTPPPAPAPVSVAAPAAVPVKPEEELFDDGFVAGRFSTMNVTTELDKQAADFDFDSLEFSVDAAPPSQPKAPIPTSAVPPARSTSAPPPVLDEDMFDLT